VFRRLADARQVPLIEVVVAAFDQEVRGMGSMRIRPDVRIQDLRPEEIDRFDAVAIPACVGGARGRHTDKGQRDLLSEETIAVVQRVHGNGGIIATMCWAENVLAKADLPHNKAYENYPTYTRKTEADYDPLPFDPTTRTITSGGPLVATEAACLLLRTLLHETEYRTFRRANPWLFGIQDEFAPRLDAAR
jgi:putative intracellular protease/amidase